MKYTTDFNCMQEKKDLYLDYSDYVESRFQKKYVYSRKKFKKQVRVFFFF